MQVHGQHPVGAGGDDQVRHQLGRDRDARLVLAVLPGVAVVGDDGRDPRRGRAAERVHHDAELHQVLVDRPGGRLDDEHVHAADVLVDLERDLRVGEAMEPGLAHRHAQEVSNLLRQQRVGAAGEEPEFRSCHAVRHPGDLFRCACSDVHDGGSGCGWGGRIRTFECGSQSPVPYHLATPHHARLHSAHTFRRRSSALADAPQSRSTAVSPKSPRPTRRGLPKGAVYRRDPTSRRKPIAYTYLRRRASLGCAWSWLCRPPASPPSGGVVPARAVAALGASRGAFRRSHWRWRPARPRRLRQQPGPAPTTPTTAVGPPDLRVVFARTQRRSRARRRGEPAAPAGPRHSGASAPAASASGRTGRTPRIRCPTSSPAARRRRAAPRPPRRSPGGAPPRPARSRCGSRRGVRATRRLARAGRTALRRAGSRPATRPPSGRRRPSTRRTAGGRSRTPCVAAPAAA